MVRLRVTWHKSRGCSCGARSLAAVSRHAVALRAATLGSTHTTLPLYFGLAQIRGETRRKAQHPRTGSLTHGPLLRAASGHLSYAHLVAHVRAFSRLLTYVSAPAVIGCYMCLDADRHERTGLELCQE